MSGTTKTIDGGLVFDRPSICLGIDQSYTGFGLTAMNEIGAYHTWVYKSKEKGVDRLLDIEDWLTKRITEVGWRSITDVAVEAPVRMSHSALMSGELFYAVRRVLRMELEGEARYPLQVPPSTLKKYVTGKGRAEKSQMMLQVYKKWGAEFNDDNAADSYGLARISNNFADTAYEKEVLLTLDDPKFREAL
jgi:Holliday junction resolvasome RuvABC endonuclease subunit